MAGRAGQLEAARWTPDRLAELRERCSAQAVRAEIASRTARTQLAEARRRRDLARQRAGDRILPMWRARSARYDRFGPVVCMWPGEPPVAVAAAEAGPATGDLGDIDMLVRGLFEVSLLITSCRTQSNAAVAERLDQAVESLDRLIHDLRLAALRRVHDHTGTAGAGSDSMEGRGTVLARLRDVSAELFGLADGKSDGAGALYWRDAAQCVSRAVQVLQQETLG